MLFVYYEARVSLVDIREGVDEDVQTLAEYFPDAIYFVAELTTQEEEQEEMPNVVYLEEPTKEWPEGSECPLHKKVHSAHGWYVCLTQKE